MGRNNKFKDDHMKFMKELTSKGYAKNSSKVTELGHCWYLPHNYKFYEMARGGFHKYSIL